MKFLKFLNMPLETFLSQVEIASLQYEIVIDPDAAETCKIVTFPKDGLEVRGGPNDLLETIFLHADEHGGFDEAQLGFSFQSTRSEMRSRFGAPEKSGEAEVIEYLGPFGPWDRYEIDGSLMHLSFRPLADEINLVTLMTPQSAP